MGFKTQELESISFSEVWGGVRESSEVPEKCVCYVTMISYSR